MKKIRLTAFILSLASCLFLFSAGFSTWFKVVLPTDIDPATGQFTAYSVVDVLANESNNAVVNSNFKYTSFAFEGENTNTISITYKFSDPTKPVRISLGYNNLSSYATQDSNFKLFGSLIDSTYDGGTKNNTITVSFTANNQAKNYTSVIGQTSSGQTENGRFNVTDNFLNENDEISFVIVPEEQTLTITYTFNVPKTEQSPGNFRQNLGKYLKAFNEPNKKDITTFTFTVVSGS